MKLFASAVAALAVGLLCFPALLATGDPAPLGCTGTSSSTVLATIRTLESGDDYTARASGSTASGAYQFISSTWAGYGGFPQAWQAPSEVQDAKADEMVVDILDAHDGDIAAVPVVWYLGHLPGPASPSWDLIPAAGAGNRLTPREYQQRWLAEYERQAAVAEMPGGGCVSGGAIEALPDGFAYPGPPDLFAVAPVDSPHHDYPAWDWGIPVGTPLYATRGGRVTATTYWPYNWWDYGCGADAAGCSSCGIGVTIEDDTGARWNYCHGDALMVATGDTVGAGQQISPRATQVAPAVRTCTSRSARPTASCVARSRCCDLCATQRRDRNRLDFRVAVARTEAFGGSGRLNRSRLNALWDAER